MQLLKNLFCLFFFLSSSILLNGQSSIKFDGSNDWVEVVDFPSLSEDYTIEYFLRVDARGRGAWSALLNFDRGSYTPWFGIRNSSLRLEFWDGRFITSSSEAITLNEWIHLAYVGNSATGGRIYINGKNVGGHAVRTTVPNGVMEIGRTARLSEYFNGKIDELRISNNARYTNDFEPPLREFSLDENTVALYHFDENEGQLALDDSGNNLHLQLGSTPNPDNNDPIWCDVNAVLIDKDGDGFSPPDDCDDNNPNIPAEVGSPCNDNDSTTNNDVILADGCTCEGTRINSSTLVPFDCSPAYYQVTDGQLKQFDVAQNDFIPIGPDHSHINATGYNIEDDFIYGLIGGNRRRLVRIGALGNIEDLGTIEGIPANLFAGDFDGRGNLYVLNNNNGRLFKIDVDAAELQVEEVEIEGSIPNLSDIAFDINRNVFYGLQRNNSNLVTIDIANGIVTQIPTQNVVKDDGFGSVYTTVEGNFYGFNNPTRSIYEVDVNTGEGTLITTIAESFGTGVDGASCPNATDIFNVTSPPCETLPTQTFTTQAQLDSFTCDCPNNTLTIEGDLIINGDDITDLSNLSCIKTVTGNVHIGDSLTIPSNDILERLDGLGGIMTIGGNLIICNNPMLRSLSGFSSLMEVGGDIQVKNCVVLASIRITVLQSVGGSFIIRGCPFLIEIGPWLLGSLPGGDFIIDGSFRLGSLGGGGNLTFIGGDLFLINTGLPDLTELKNLITLLGCFHIINNEQIIDLRGLSSLQEIGEDVRIKNNEFITNLDSLSSLTTINGSLIIMGNPQLTSLDGLRNLTIVGDTLMVTFNNTLNSCCGINDLLQNGGVGGPIMISANLQGCMSPMDINTTCTVDCENLGLNVGAICSNDDGVEGIVNGVCICVTDTPLVDMDQDGFTNDVDCDDNNPAIYPGATEIMCDGIDSNCNGENECNQPICIVGEACDDGNIATINDTVTTACICMGTDTTTVIVDSTFCPEFNAFIGTPCDDNDPTTEDEWLEEGCNCVGKVINGCNAVITVRDNTVIVEGVNGAQIKVHLYDRTFSNIIDATCNYYNDCEGTQIFSDLLPGVYAVQYQSFNDDWTNIICDSVVYVEVAALTNETGCEGVDIQVTNGVLKIDKLPTLNTIIDVYDPSYKSMFNCIGDCGTSQIIENLPAGNYLVRLKVYDVFWNFICEREERIDIAATIGETTEDRVPAPEITPSIGRFSGIIVDKLTVFPNPTAENINISTNNFVGKNRTITLIDMFGRVVQKHQLDKVTDSIFTININGYDAGVYQIIASSKEQSLTAKVIILR